MDIVLLNKLAIESLYNGNFSLLGNPTSVEEFNEMFKPVVGIDDNGINIFETNTFNFPITYEQFDMSRLNIEREYLNLEYQRKRANEYPPITDYLDGIVKGDTTQVQEYIDKCLAIKAKYPKGEVNGN